jgi:hypothetical protein
MRPKLLNRYTDAYENLYALNLKIDEAKQTFSERNENSWRYSSRRNHQH